MFLDGTPEYCFTKEGGNNTIDLTLFIAIRVTIDDEFTWQQTKFNTHFFYKNKVYKNIRLRFARTLVSKNLKTKSEVPKKLASLVKRKLRSREAF